VAAAVALTYLHQEITAALAVVLGMEAQEELGILRQHHLHRVATEAMAVLLLAAVVVVQVLLVLLALLEMAAMGVLVLHLRLPVHLLVVPVVVVAVVNLVLLLVRLLKAAGAV
jgi:hypothetical protein